MNPKRYVDSPDAPFLAMLGYRLFLVATVYALFLPFFGPMLDHHFAERQYHHQHIYFGSAGVEHVHFYELAHSHTHYALATPPGNAPLGNESPNEVVYFTSQDGVGQSFLSFTATSLYVDFVVPDLGDNQFLFGFTNQDNLPPEIFIAPPKRPPRI